MTSPLERLATPGGALAGEAPDANETAGLIRSGRARLADARNPALSPEGRFDLAYNAAHALCLAALRRLGYRAKQRYIVFQVLPPTRGTPRSMRSSCAILSRRLRRLQRQSTPSQTLFKGLECPR